MGITASQVKELREKSGAGMLDCKKALEETNGDMDKAVNLLREKGLASASKKSGRVAAEGLVDSYIHGGRIGVLIEVNSETDFVSKTKEFQEFVRDMAMQVAASNPKYVGRDDVPKEEVEEEREVLVNQVVREGKPEHVAEQIVEGRMGKFYEGICLLDQPFIKDPSIKIKDVLNEKIAQIGENLQIRRFVRFEVGEGLEKREENLADEVAKQIGD
ncbi:MAG TPA: translation elongation factor Ts [Tissierellaceae bacterium]|nr:translation elongation factor Ts [Tissierellaceae bacterium]